MYDIADRRIRLGIYHRTICTCMILLTVELDWGSIVELYVHV